VTPLITVITPPVPRVGKEGVHVPRRPTDIPSVTWILAPSRFCTGRAFDSGIASGLRYELATGPVSSDFCFCCCARKPIAMAKACSLFFNVCVSLYSSCAI